MSTDKFSERAAFDQLEAACEAEAKAQPGWCKGCNPETCPGCGEATPTEPALPSAEEIERTIGYRLPAYSLNLLFNLMRKYAAPATPSGTVPAKVWEATNKTSTVLFASKECGKQWIAQFPASVAGGFELYERDVHRLAAPAAPTMTEAGDPDCQAALAAKQPT
jgi:hypothetical protein